MSLKETALNLLERRRTNMGGRATIHLSEESKPIKLKTYFGLNCLKVKLSNNPRVPQGV